MTRRGPLLLVLLVAACGHTQSVVSGLQPGVDVAQAALRGGSPQTALQLASNVLATDPGNEAALVVQGDALTELGRFNEAHDSYNRALQSNHDSVGAEVGLGRLHLTDDPQAASVLFLQALDHDPRNTKALNDLGVALDLQGKHEAAQAVYARLLNLSPNDRAASVNMALSLSLSGQPVRSVAMLRGAGSRPDAAPRVRQDLAVALALSGNTGEAEKLLLTDLSPSDAAAALAGYRALGITVK